MERKCETCGKIFFVIPSREAARFCSTRCWGLSKRKQVECVCKECGKIFSISACRVEVGEGIFCSIKCYQISRRNQIKRKCEHCGIPFYTIPARVKQGKGRFCSRECAWKSRRRQIQRKCKLCDKTFYTYPYKLKAGRGKFCSLTCYKRWKENRVERKCEQCGRGFKVRASEIKRGVGRFCSRKCYEKWKIGNRIVKHCERCDKAFFVRPSGNKRKYCSQSCARKSRKGFPTHHTKPELIFEGICKKHNLHFKYTGDGSLWIGKKGKTQLNPDFIQADGEKIIVEVLGDYWHSPLLNRKIPEHGTLTYRKKHYKRFKWDPIFIWESDLKRKDAEQFVLNLLCGE